MQPGTVEATAQELNRRKSSRVIRRITDRQQQDEETLLYWQSRTTLERLEACFELIRAAYIAKGYDADTLGRSERSLTRLQR